MKLDKDFVDPLIGHFYNNPALFFVASKDDCAIAGFRYGVLQPQFVYGGYNEFINERGYTLSAGIGAFDRKRFIELGGYDELYLPGRFEDVDLCYRGWKRGYKGICEPRSRQYHKGMASFSKEYSSDEISRLVFRNEILFMIKNITSPFIFLRFILFLFCRLAFYFIFGKFTLLGGFLDAIRRLPQALRSRRLVCKKFTISDEEVIKIVNAKYENFKKGQNFKLSYFAKKAVNLLSQTPPSVKKVFFCGSFLTVRIFYPLEHFILKELIDMESVLDLGCGRHSFVGILPPKVKKVGVEIYEPYIKEAVESKRLNHIVKADIKDVSFKEKSFDAVVALDVIEHLEKQDALELMRRMERWARRKVVIFTPNGFLEQGPLEDNPYQRHCSGWDVTFFKDNGYKVYGVRGIKQLRRKANDRLSAVLVDLTQLLTYFLPKTAYQLFCMKEIRHSPVS
jgi:hypothetical protein